MHPDVFPPVDLFYGNREGEAEMQSYNVNLWGLCWTTASLRYFSACRLNFEARGRRNRCMWDLHFTKATSPTVLPAEFRRTLRKREPLPWAAWEKSPVFIYHKKIILLHRVFFLFVFALSTFSTSAIQKSLFGGTLLASYNIHSLNSDTCVPHLISIPSFTSCL